MYGAGLFRGAGFARFVQERHRVAHGKDPDPQDAQHGPGGKAHGHGTVRQPGPTITPPATRGDGSGARFDKRVLQDVPVDTEGTTVDSWLFTRAPLSGPRTDAKRVIVVHGLGDAPVTWFSCLRHALEDCELVLPALPGAGRGPLPQGMDHLDFTRTKAWLSQVLGLLEEETQGDVVVIGHSLGGWLVARALLDDPSLAKRIRPPVLVNTAGTWYDGVERERELLSPRQLEDVDELLMQIYARPPEMPVEALQSLLETMQDPGYRGLLWSTSKEDFLRPGDIARLPERTGIVWGLKDRLVPSQAFETLRKNLRAPQVESIESCGHAPHLEAPVKTAEVFSRLTR